MIINKKNKYYKNGCTHVTEVHNVYKIIKYTILLEGLPNHDILLLLFYFKIVPPNYD